MINYAINTMLNGDTPTFSSGEQKWNYLNEKDAGEIFLRFATKNVSNGFYLVANNNS